jgi:MSHA biogenesis protein MshQ
VAPVITVTAQSLAGTTTLNYTGSLFRLTNASLIGRTYTPTPASPTLTTTGLPATTSDPAIVSSGGGVGTLTFSTGTGLLFTRGAPIAPLSANIALSINVIDLDSVAATTNPVTFGAGSGIPFTTTGNTQYYGRLALRDALGSELLDLPMSLTTQYYLSATQGFTPNTADVCTVAPAIAFSNPLQNVTVAEMCVRDTGSPGVSGAGCPTAASSALQYDPVAVAGGFNLILAAPGSGNNGAITVTATPYSWLLYPWSVSSGINSAPTANGTFGIFPGPPSRIYQRETY